ncbi:MAG: SDR family oxidoreductase, partial [Xanthobacteraceae bacterium]
MPSENQREADDKKTRGQDGGDIRRGIRQATAVRLAEDGAQIVIADRAKADKTLQLIAAIGGKASAIECDVGNPVSVTALKEQVEKGNGCDILVNNAGI